MTNEEHKQIMYCLSLYKKLREEPNANNLFRYFYEIEGKLKRIVNDELNT